MVEAASASNKDITIDLASLHTVGEYAPFSLLGKPLVIGPFQGQKLPEQMTE